MNVAVKQSSPFSVPPPAPVLCAQRTRGRSFGMPGWLISLLFHEFALILLAVISAKVAMGPQQGQQLVVSWDEGQRDDPASGDAGLLADSLAMMKESAAEAQFKLRAATAQAFETSIDVPSVLEMAELPSSQSSSDDLQRILAKLGGGGGGESGGAGAGDRGLGGSGSTRLFELEAQGRKFVYVFDRSQSMSEFGGVPLEAAKRELISSIHQLDSRQQFYIVTYNQKPRQYNPANGRLSFATNANRRQAEQFINDISANGGTQHFEALLMAVRLKPDVIFLITDAEEKDDLTIAELRRLEQFNSGGATIHVILFTPQPRPNSTLVRLARHSGGKHRFVDIRRLRPPDRSASFASP